MPWRSGRPAGACCSVRGRSRARSSSLLITAHWPPRPPAPHHTSHTRPVRPCRRAHRSSAGSQARRAQEGAGAHLPRRGEWAGAHSTRSKRGRSCKLTSIGGRLRPRGRGASLIQCCGRRRRARRHSSSGIAASATTLMHLLFTCAGTAVIDSLVVPAQRPLACQHLCRHKQERSFRRHTVPAHNVVRWNDGACFLLFFLPSRVPWVQ